MAGDWIKMRSNLWTDPRVAMLCDLTGCVEPMVIGGLFWLWTTADQHTEDGFMPGLSAAAIDRRSGVAGLGGALLAVGWIEMVAAIPGSAGNPCGIRISHFEEHNGASAKKRMVTAKRVASHRLEDATVTLPALQDAHASVTPALARERERVEEEGKSTPLVAGLPAADQLIDQDGKVIVPASRKPDCPHQEIIKLYHAILPMCPEVRDWTPARQSALRARWNENPKHQTLDYWQQLFEYIADHCDFLTGKAAGKSKWTANLEWIVQQGNFAKIRERNYENN